MEPVKLISRYAHDFGISQDDITKCISMVAKKTGVSQSNVSYSVLQHIHRLVSNCIDKAAKHKMPLKSYQELAVKHMLVNRGMVAAFDVGTGKTLTAVTVASCILNLAKFFGQDIRVIVITPTSLQTNFRKEMKAYGADPNDKRYTFYTTNKFGIDYKAGLIDCKRTLFIVDEAHVFRTDFRKVFSGIGAGTEDTRAELAIVCASKAWKVLLLTATPLYNKEFDLINLTAMTRGQFPPSTENPLGLAERDPDLFRKTYGKTILFQGSDETLFPRRRDVLVKIIMTPNYLEKYEDLERRIKESKAGKSEKGEAEVKEAFMGRLRAASNTLDVCLKCKYTMKIVNRGEKTIIFSSFKSAGIELVKKDLKKNRVGFYLITGDTPSTRRDKIVADFNDKKGHKVLMITRAGGEGLDLKEVRNVILFEKGWNVAGEEQVIGRAVRLKSHKDLDKKDQLVTVYHLVVVKPMGARFMTIDDSKNIELSYIKCQLEEDDKKMRKPHKKYDVDPKVFLSEFSNFVKEIVINEEYALPMGIDECAAKEGKDPYGVEVYMFINGLRKNRSIMELRSLLKEIEISEKNIFDPFPPAEIEIETKYMPDSEAAWG